MIAVLSLFACSQTSLASVEVGRPAPDFTLPDLDGKTVSLAAQLGKTVVLEWFNPGCPFVVKAHGEGPLADMASKQDADVVWLAINSGAPGKQGHGVEANRAAAEQWKMGHPILLDEKGEVGRAYGATNTPQMVVIDPKGTVAYAGALDNAPLGDVKGESLIPYTANAIAAVRSGAKVEPATTKAWGCGVKY